MSSVLNDTLRIKVFSVGPLDTNCYLAYGDMSKKGVLIDPGDRDPGIKRTIEDEKIDILFTLNTHGHADHIKGDSFFSYPVAIHSLDLPCLSDPGRNLSFNTGWSVDPVTAGKELSDGDVLEIGSLIFDVIHTPGHTPGCICLKCGDVLFSGDTLFYEGVGRTDLPGGDQRALVESIKNRIFVLPDHTRVLPGHGPETTIGHEKRYNPFL